MITDLIPYYPYTLYPISLIPLPLYPLPLSYCTYCTIQVQELGLKIIES